MLAALVLLNVFSLNVSTAHAIVAEPMESAVETLGFQLVGEVEFARGASRAKAADVKTRADDVGRLCPDLAAAPTEPVRLLILSWADQEYPRRRRPAGSSARRLAAARGAELARSLRPRVPGEVSFELVNMATRAPTAVAPGRRAIGGPSTDVKSVLVDAGAAPTNPWEFGLFGEYAQSSKAVIWVDCDTHVPTQRAALDQVTHVAAQ